MKFVFATPLSSHGSTIIGRIRPLAAEFALVGHETHALLVGEVSSETAAGLHEHSIGSEPFVRSPAGKTRLKGISLIMNMLGVAWRTSKQLRRLAPDVVVIVKPLPSNVLGVYLWKLLGGRAYIVLDTDDFELTANLLSSLIQRAAINWSERTAARLADTIVAASPFLVDHFRQLTSGRRPVILVPTGLTVSDTIVAVGDSPGELLYIGSVSIGSGHRVDLLPAILAAVRQDHAACSMTIAGDGDDVDTLKESFAALGLADAVTWTGRFTPAAVNKLLTDKSIILDPIDSSIEVRAKSSYRVAVASALGLPVVTSDVGIRPQLIPQDLHELFFATPESAQDYAAKISDLLDTGLTAAQRDSLQTHTSQFAWERLAQTYLDSIAI